MHGQQNVKIKIICFKIFTFIFYFILELHRLSDRKHEKLFKEIRRSSKHSFFVGRLKITSSFPFFLFKQQICVAVHFSVPQEKSFYNLNIATSISSACITEGMIKSKI